MFDQFPKSRPFLPKDIEEIATGYHKLNRAGDSPATSLSQKMEVWLHKKVAEDIQGIQNSTATLEIGAGTLNHLPYEPEAGTYDVIEPCKPFYEGSSRLARIRTIYSDITEIPENVRYDRIISIATFEHICNLPEVVASSGRMLKPDGVLRVSIPSEGTVLWTLGWKLTTGLEFKMKYGLDYGLLVKHEHVNTAKEIEEVLRFFFADVKCKVFGLCRSLSFYQFFACKQPDLQRCQQFTA